MLQQEDATVENVRTGLDDSGTNISVVTLIWEENIVKKRLYFKEGRDGGKKVQYLFKVEYLFET